MTWLYLILIENFIIFTSWLIHWLKFFWQFLTKREVVFHGFIDFALEECIISFLHDITSSFLVVLKASERRVCFDRSTQIWRYIRFLLTTPAVWIPQSRRIPRSHIIIERIFNFEVTDYLKTTAIDVHDSRNQRFYVSSARTNRDIICYLIWNFIPESKIFCN